MKELEHVSNRNGAPTIWLVTMRLEVAELRESSPNLLRPEPVVFSRPDPSTRPAGSRRLFGATGTSSM